MTIRNLGAKTETVRARVTPAEYTALAALAESQERTPSEVIRELIRTAAKRQGLWPLAQNEGDQ